MTEEPTGEGPNRPLPAERVYADASPFQQARPEPLLGQAIPISQDLPTYRPQTGRRDVIAGLTVAALAIPSALAYGELAGVSPANGLLRPAASDGRLCPAGPVQTGRRRP